MDRNPQEEQITAERLEGLGNAIVDYNARKRREEQENNSQKELGRILTAHQVALAPKGTWIHQLMPGEAGIIVPWLVEAQKDTIKTSGLTPNRPETLIVPDVTITSRGVSDKLSGTLHAIVERRPGSGEYVVTHLLSPRDDFKEEFTSYLPPHATHNSTAITVKGTLKFEQINVSPFQ